MSYVCAYSSVQLDKSSVEKQFTSFFDRTSCVLSIAEFESVGRQSIRVDCGPARNMLNHELRDGDGDDDDVGDGGNYVEEDRYYDDDVEPVLTTLSYDEMTESIERTVTSANGNSVTSPIPAAAAETSVVMTTAGVTSSNHVTSDYSSSSLNFSRACLTNHANSCNAVTSGFSWVLNTSPPPPWNKCKKIIT